MNSEVNNIPENDHDHDYWNSEDPPYDDDVGDENDGGLAGASGGQSSTGSA
jgi:hypothetical protein